MVDQKVVARVAEMVVKLAVMKVDILVEMKVVYLVLLLADTMVEVTVAHWAYSTAVTKAGYSVDYLLG